MGQWLELDMGRKKAFFPLRGEVLDLCMLMKASGREQIMEDTGKRRHSRREIPDSARREVSSAE